MTEKKPPRELQGFDPTKTYFAAYCAANIDGSVDLGSSESLEGVFETEAEAIDCLKGLNEAYPSLCGYVYELRPTRRVWRGEIRISSVEKVFKPRVDWRKDRYHFKFDPEKHEPNPVDHDDD